jgi:CDP-diacylglycerol--serine O-phosphatidyltransferase
MQNSKKLSFFLPNIFTALNMACGFASITLSIEGRFESACILLILGAIFDSVDGRIARITGTSSHFGEQFDSMSDLISFGAAPSFLLYQKYLHQYERLGAVIAFLYILCGALRLARFNANIEKIRSDFFQGLPIPGAAMALIGFILFSEAMPQFDYYMAVAPFYTFILD